MSTHSIMTKLLTLIKTLNLKTSTGPNVCVYGHDLELFGVQPGDRQACVPSALLFNSVIGWKIYHAQLNSPGVLIEQNVVVSILY